MARYYFHIQDRLGAIRDEEGAEFSSLDNAKEEAKASAKDAARTYLAQGVPLDSPCVEICDELGTVVAAISVREVLAHPEAPRFAADCGEAKRSAPSAPKMQRAPH